MGLLKDQVGFEFINNAMDGIIVISGAANYSTSTDTLNSNSSRSMTLQNDTAERRFIGGALTGSEYWVISRVLRNSLSTVSNSRVGVFNTGAAIPRVGIQVGYVNGSMELNLLVAGILVGTTVGLIYPINTWGLLYLHVSNHAAGGTVSLHFNSPFSPAVASHVLTAQDITDLVGLPDSWLFASAHASAITLYDDCLVFDPVAAGATLLGDVANPSLVFRDLTGAGFYTAQTSGVFSDINQRPPNASAVNFAAAGAKASFVAEDADPLMGEMHGVKIAGLISADFSAGNNVEIGIVNTAGSQEILQTFPAVASGVVQGMFPLAPDGGAWSPADWDDTQPVCGSVA